MKIDEQWECWTLCAIKTEVNVPGGRRDDTWDHLLLPRSWKVKSGTDTRFVARSVKAQLLTVGNATCKMYPTGVPSNLSRKCGCIPQWVRTQVSTVVFQAWHINHVCLWQHDSPAWLGFSVAGSPNLSAGQTRNKSRKTVMYRFFCFVHTDCWKKVATSSCTWPSKLSTCWEQHCNSYRWCRMTAINNEYQSVSCQKKKRWSTSSGDGTGMLHPMRDKTKRVHGEG